MPEPQKVYVAKDEPHHGKRPTNTPRKSRPRRKINLILENLINSSGEIKKVAIPNNVSMRLLKEAIGQLFDLHPNQFQLIIDDSYRNTTKSVKKVKLVSSSAETKKQQEKVKIILQSSIGPDGGQKKVQIPKDVKISVVKSKIAEIFELEENEFELVHVKSGHTVD